MSFGQSTVFVVSLMAFMFLMMALVGFLRPQPKFGRIIAPYLLCTGTLMTIALVIAYINTILQVWITAKP